MKALANKLFCTYQKLKLCPNFNMSREQAIVVGNMSQISCPKNGSNYPCTSTYRAETFDLYYDCACLPGYSGVYCEENIDECLSLPCLDPMECIDGDNEYECRCPIDNPDCESKEDTTEALGSIIGIIIVCICGFILIIIIVIYKVNERKRKRNGLRLPDTKQSFQMKSVYRSSNLNQSQSIDISLKHDVQEADPDLVFIGMPSDIIEDRNIPVSSGCQLSGSTKPVIETKQIGDSYGDRTASDNVQQSGTTPVVQTNTIQVLTETSHSHGLSERGETEKVHTETPMETECASEIEPESVIHQENTAISDDIDEIVASEDAYNGKMYARDDASRSVRVRPHHAWVYPAHLVLESEHSLIGRNIQPMILDFKLSLTVDKGPSTSASVSGQPSTPSSSPRESTRNAAAIMSPFSQDPSTSASNQSSRPNSIRARSQSADNGKTKLKYYEKTLSKAERLKKATNSSSRRTLIRSKTAPLFNFTSAPDNQ